jgi:hypothetical protein
MKILKINVSSKVFILTFALVGLFSLFNHALAVETAYPNGNKAGAVCTVTVGKDGWSNMAGNSLLSGVHSGTVNADGYCSVACKPSGNCSFAIIPSGEKVIKDNSVFQGSTGFVSGGKSSCGGQICSETEQCVGNQCVLNVATAGGAADITVGYTSIPANLNSLTITFYDSGNKVIGAPLTVTDLKIAGNTVSVKAQFPAGAAFYDVRSVARTTTGITATGGASAKFFAPPAAAFSATAKPNISAKTTVQVTGPGEFFANLGLAFIGQMNVVPTVAAPAKLSAQSIANFSSLNASVSDFWAAFNSAKGTATATSAAGKAINNLKASFASVTNGINKIFNQFNSEGAGPAMGVSEGEGCPQGCPSGKHCSTAGECIPNGPTTPGPGLPGI